MSAGRGFTLIEVVVSVTLAGVIALLVYGSARAGLDTERRLSEQRRELQSAQAMRALVWDALRNARPPREPSDPALVLEDRYDSRGRPMDRLAFVAAGSFPPLSAGTDWFVVLEPTEDGLTLSAEPVGLRERRRIVARLPAITNLQVRVLEYRTSNRWVESWPFESIVPRAVELVYSDQDGQSGTPQRIALPLGGGRR